MASLYVDEPGAGLVVRDGELQVRKGEETLHHVPLANVDRLALVRNASLSSALVTALLKQGVPVFFLSGQGRLLGRAGPPCGNNSRRLIRQVECYRDDGWRLRTARALVWSRLQGCCELIDRRLRHEASPELHQTRSEIEILAQKAATAETLARLRGYEGQASRLAFGAWSGMFNDPELRPERRSKRPPKDPVNALLSFVSCLVTAELATRLEMAGLDPGIGFYHDLSYGRDSLACDLVEEFRHLVQRMVLGFFNRGQFTRDDFVRDDKGGVRLTDSARKRFYVCYEKALTGGLLKGRHCRDLFEQQVRELVSAIDHGRDYVPWCCREQMPCSSSSPTT